MRRRTFLGGALATAATILIGTRASRTSSTMPTPPSRALPTGDLAKIVPLGSGSDTYTVSVGWDRIKEASLTGEFSIDVDRTLRLTREEIEPFFPGAHAHTVTITLPEGAYGYATFLDRESVTLNPGANIIQGKKPSTATLKSVEHGEAESIYHWKVGDGERVITKDIVIPK